MLRYIVPTCVALCIVVSGQVVQLNPDNIDSILAENELVFVNYYADWCRFSNMLTPIFSEGAAAVAEAIPEKGKVVFGRVDCDRETDIAQKYRISKYPTLKLIRFGEVMKREYRGQRSKEAFLQYIKEQLVNPVEVKASVEEMDAIIDDKRNMLVYVADSNTNTYTNILRTASQLRTDCKWYAVIGPAGESKRNSGEDTVYFRQANTQGSDIPFTGLTNVESLTSWARELCTPRVRELTFENAEEMTEEGLPFLILFHAPEDTESPEIFKEQVNLQLSGHKDVINTLTADGLKFAHPLSHLGKTSADLPLIAIDSFKHMYVFKHDVRKDLRQDGLLLQFVNDLSSGKLHREFHNGPDPTQPPPPKNIQADGGQHLNRNAPPSQDPQKKEEPTSPPESVFQKLAPSHNRYTVLTRDEL